MNVTVSYRTSWVQLWDHLYAAQQRLYNVQTETFSSYRASKLMGFKDSERLYYELDPAPPAPLPAYATAWTLYRDELTRLLVVSQDEGYGAGLSAALSLQSALISP